MTDTALRVSFPTPLANPKTGAGLQEFRVRVRKAGTAITHPTCRIELYETGDTTPLSTPVSDTSVSNTTGVVLSGTWNASLLSQPTGAAVEVKVVGTGVTNGSIEIDGIKWIPSVAYTRTVNDHPGIADSYLANGVPGATGSFGVDGADIYFEGTLTWLSLSGEDLIFDTSGPVTTSGDDVILSA